MRAYHFVGDTLRDGRPVPADGEWLVHTGNVVMCQSGLHASVHPFDALQYAPGDTLCLVDIESEPARDFWQDSNKVAGNRRRIVKRIDATDLLRAFAREVALSVVHLWDAPEVVVEYLKTGDPTLRAAAWAAAGAAGAAAGAAGAAAWAAAWAAGTPVMAAGVAAAAAESAVESATGAAQRQRFAELVAGALGGGE